MRYTPLPNILLSPGLFSCDAELHVPSLILNLCVLHTTQLLSVRILISSSHILTSLRKLRTIYWILWIAINTHARVWLGFAYTFFYTTLEIGSVLIKAPNIVAGRENVWYNKLHVRFTYPLQPNIFKYHPFTQHEYTPKISALSYQVEMYQD